MDDGITNIRTLENDFESAVKNHRCVYSLKTNIVQSINGGYANYIYLSSSTGPWWRRMTATALTVAARADDTKSRSLGTSRCPSFSRRWCQCIRVTPAGTVTIRITRADITAPIITVKPFYHTTLFNKRTWSTHITFWRNFYSEHVARNIFFYFIPLYKREPFPKFFLPWKSRIGTFLHTFPPGVPP